MNDRLRKQVIKLTGVAGSSLFALSTIFLLGGASLGWKIPLSFVAGTAGHFAFTALATWLMRLEKERSLGRPGELVYRFQALPEAEQAAAGGKGRVLAKLAQAGYPVPDGIIVLPRAFNGDDIAPAGWQAVQTQLAGLRRAGQEVSFAVRSSALNEDSAQASFAGAFESVLDVRSDAELRAALSAVRRSRHTARVQAYSQAQGLAGDGAAGGGVASDGATGGGVASGGAASGGAASEGNEMAVVIQRLVRGQHSGVLFTVDPLTRDLHKMTGNFVTGLGERLVSGEATPLTFTFTRPNGAYQGPDELRPAARKLHDLANDIENEMGGPQDIEWTVAQGRVFVLQARPISTLNGFDTWSGSWNDTRQGDFLWSATNLMEAYPEVMTPFTASLRPYLDAHGGPALSVKNYPLNGVIGGRFYANLSVQISAFLPLFGGNVRRAYQELAGWWGEIPADLDIPLVPIRRSEWFRDVLPRLLQSNGEFARYRKQAPKFVETNSARCAELNRKIEQAQAPAELADLWHSTIFPAYREAMFMVIASGSDLQLRLERELRSLVGQEDANALLSNLGGPGAYLESLGPVIGLQQVARGELSRAAYLERYGHRGENEGEVAWPRPMEDPHWLDRRLAEAAQAAHQPLEQLAAQQAAVEAAWQRFGAAHPRKVEAYRKKFAKAAQAAQQRERVRSEASRGGTVLRAFALRAGALSGIGEDVFYLTIDETLGLLSGRTGALRLVACRKDAYQRLKALPSYPALICGSFDPFAWAAQPNRRQDLFDSRQASASAAPAAAADANQVRGFAGALGIVEGTVRQLERLEEGHLLQPGEVLVTRLTNIGWTPLFPRAAAIVTDLGAPLSHAAIVARELGIPAVVGCGDATTRLKTGDRVRVDGGSGRVDIL